MPFKGAILSHSWQYQLKEGFLFTAIPIKGVILCHEAIIFKVAILVMKNHLKEQFLVMTQYHLKEQILVIKQYHLKERFLVM